VLKSFDHQMDFNKFQKTVYPRLKETTIGKNKGGKPLSGMHPYVLYNTLKNAGLFSMDKLIHCQDELVEIDIAMKTTAKDPKLLLERFIINFCL
jgi:DNA polymerase III delta subunit